MENNTAPKGLMSLLSNTSPVTLVANENIEGHPLVTALLNQDGTPKTDLMGNSLGSIMLRQKTKSLANGSFLNVRNRVAFIGGTLEALNNLLKEAGLKDGSEIPGKIYVTESLEPFWKGQTPKMNPQTQEEIGVQVGEKHYPVFLKMTFTEDMNVKDTFIRTAEDVAAWAASRTVLKATANMPAPETAGMPSAPATTN